jgi:transcriptional regulator GlxA family with amidase domain
MIDVFFVLLPATLLLDVSGPAEAFRLANQQRLEQGAPALYRLHFVGPRASIESSIGLTLAGLAPLPPQLPACCHLLLPGRAGDLGGTADERAAWRETRDWLSHAVAGRLRGDDGLRLMTVCAGALLAADAGLLDGRQVTTHHESLDELAAMAPGVRVVSNRVWVEDGAVWSSAGITAGIDLALHAITRDADHAVAAAVARTMVVFARRGAHAPGVSPFLAWRDHLHPALHRVQDAVCDRPGEDWDLARLAQLAHVTSRHLTRLFVEQAGVTPRDYVEHVRVSLAQAALEAGRSAAQACELAGFRSEQQWRRARARRAG